MQYYPDLFEWWVTSISFSIVFLTIVSIYLYVNSKTRRREINRAAGEKSRLRSNFIFVWILLSLLVLYVVSVNMSSYMLFALGNIIVELILIAYVAKNKSRKVGTA
ncbi:MAG: hypothetical protein WED05_07310 [Candidatus Atabeyarchaeum deiterrae]